MITLKSALPWVVGIGTGVAFLLLTLTQLDPGAIARVWMQVEPAWMLPAVVAFGVAMIARVLRWRELLGSLRKLGFSEVGRPLLVGYALNYIFPARLGELFRAHYARDIFRLSRSSVLGTIVAERAFDLLAIVAFLVTGLMYALDGEMGDRSLPITLLKSAMLVLGLLGLGILSLWLIQRSGVMSNFPALNRRAMDFGEGLHSIFRSHLPALLLATAMISGLEITAIWCMLAASGAELSLSQIALVMGCVSLSTLIPNAPGFIGTFQFAFFVSLNLIDHDGAHGVVAATFTQLCLFLPVTVIGVVLMLRSGVKIK